MVWIKLLLLYSKYWLDKAPLLHMYLSHTGNPVSVLILGLQAGI